MTQLRRAVVDDAAAIAAVHIASSEETYAPLAATWSAPNPATREAMWAQTLREKPGVLLVAAVDGAIVGFVHGGSARASLLLVLRSARRSADRGAPDRVPRRDAHACYIRLPPAMTSRDDLPFGDSSDLAAGVTAVAVGSVAGELVRHGIQGQEQKSLRRRAQHWAVESGFACVDAEITRDMDGVAVKLAFYELTPSTAILRATSVRPVNPLVLSIEPKSWSHRLRDLLGGSVKTADPAFDKAWHARASDPSAAAQLLDDACRDALRRTIGVVWCRATYDKGAVEVRLDADDLAGRHVLAGMDVAAAFARSEIRTTAYR